VPPSRSTRAMRQIEPNLVPLLRVLVKGKAATERLLSVGAHNRCASNLREDLVTAGCTREALHVPKTDPHRATTSRRVPLRPRSQPGSWRHLETERIHVSTREGVGRRALELRRALGGAMRSHWKQRPWRRRGFALERADKQVSFFKAEVAKVTVLIAQSELANGGVVGSDADARGRAAAGSPGSSSPNSRRSRTRPSRRRSLCYLDFDESGCCGEGRPHGSRLRRRPRARSHRRRDRSTSRGTRRGCCRGRAHPAVHSRAQAVEGAGVRQHSLVPSEEHALFAPQPVSLVHSFGAGAPGQTGSAVPRRGQMGNLGVALLQL
jgi:hypothetical protein